MKIFVNCLTIFRIISAIMLPIAWKYLTPFYLILYVSITLFTDFLDGKFARAFNVQTLFGSLMDTVADKIFGIAIVIVLMHIYKLFYLIFISEILIMVVNVIAVIRGAKVTSSMLGKAKMWVLSICIVVSLLFYYQINIINIINIINYSQEFIVDMCIFITVGTEIIVIIDYIGNFIKQVNINKTRIEYKKNSLKLKNKKDLKYVLFDTQYFMNNKNKPLSQSLFK